LDESIGGLKKTQAGAHPFLKQKTYKFTKVNDTILSDFKEKSKQVAVIENRVKFKLKELYEQKLKEAIANMKVQQQQQPPQEIVAPA